MRHAVVVLQIGGERLPEFFGRTVLQTNAVVASGIVDQHIQLPECRQGFGHGPLALLRVGQVGLHEQTALVLLTQFFG